MKRVWLNTLGILVTSIGIFGCSQEQDSKIKEAVEEAVTSETKAYEGAKQSLEGIEKKSQERREKEQESLN
jgi:hypothetical protein